MMIILGKLKIQQLEQLIIKLLEKSVISLKKYNLDITVDIYPINIEFKNKKNVFEKRE